MVVSPKYELSFDHPKQSILRLEKGMLAILLLCIFLVFQLQPESLFSNFGDSALVVGGVIFNGPRGMCVQLSQHV